MRTPASCLLIALCACSSEPAATPKAAPEPESRPPASRPAAPPTPAPLPAASGEVVFTPQPGWTVETPSSRMRKAQLKVADGLRLVIYHFGHGKGGTVEANMNRWIAQLQQPDGSSSREAAIIRKLTPSPGLTVHRLDVSGTYVAAVRPGATERHRKPDHRLLAAVIVGGKGPYFIKLIGPAAVVADQVERFDAFLAALKVAP